MFGVDLVITAGITAGTAGTATLRDKRVGPGTPRISPLTDVVKVVRGRALVVIRRLVGGI